MSVNHWLQQTQTPLHWVAQIMFYAPVLFSSLGSGETTALVQTIITGAVNVLATVVAIVVVDRGGRRMLFFEGGVQMALAEICMAGLIAWSFRAGAAALSSGVRIPHRSHAAHAGSRSVRAVMVRTRLNLYRGRPHDHLPEALPPASIASKRSVFERNPEGRMACHSVCLRFRRSQRSSACSAVH